VVDDCLGTASGTAFLSFAFPCFFLPGFVRFLFTLTCSSSFSFSLIVVWVQSSLAISLLFLFAFFLSFSALQSKPQTTLFGPFAHLTFVVLILFFSLSSGAVVES